MFLPMNRRWPMFFPNPLGENNLQHDSVTSTTSPPRSKNIPQNRLLSPHREVASAFKSISPHKSAEPSQHLPAANTRPVSGESADSRPPTSISAPSLPAVHGIKPYPLQNSNVHLSNDERPPLPPHPALLGLKEGAPCPPTSHHPAFPLPMNLWGLQPSQPYHVPPLHHMFSGEKAFLNTSVPYLNDPLAIAAVAAKSPFFDIARMQAGHYPLGKKLFGCPQCRYITDRKNNLKRHIATMHQECDKVLECCGVVFKNKASLRDHVLIFHSNGYMCRFCGRNFCRKALLKRHLTVHSGQKDYLCTLCDYATSHKSNLERHKKVHERQGTDDEREDDDDDIPLIPESPPLSPSRHAAGLFLHGHLAHSHRTALEEHLSMKHSRSGNIHAKLTSRPSSDDLCITPERTVAKKTKLTSHSIADICQENLQNSSSDETSIDDDDQNSVIDVVELNN